MRCYPYKTARKTESGSKNISCLVSLDVARFVLQCRHPEVAAKFINNSSLVYLRSTCRLCMCVSGHLRCEPKPASCPDSKLPPQSCQLQNEQVVPHGAFHYDGCNSCRCRNGTLEFSVDNPTESSLDFQSINQSINHQLVNQLTCLSIDQAWMLPVFSLTNMSKM